MHVTLPRSCRPKGRAAGLSERVFCKATQDLQNRMVLGISGGAECEVNFYNYVRPFVDIESPIAYYTKLDPVSFNSLIVLGDITDQVESFCDHKTPINRARVESQISLLGRLHGAAYSDPSITRNLGAFSTWPEYFERTLAFGMEAGVKKAVGESAPVMPERLKSVSPDRMWDLMVESVDRHNRLPLTFMHGDVHLKNWYVLPGDRMGLSDWQCCARGHWSRDVAYTIATALTIENRRAWEKELIQLYLEILERSGGPRVGFDEAWLHYRQQLMTVYTWWAITLCPPESIPDMQPLDITMEFIRRILAAMDDVGSIDAFN